jgi:predicted NUDIX family NTP pyrophosphohydrolase
MTKKRSAGLLIFRRRPAGLEVFLVHPGGPFWKNKDAGSWSIPKGEFDESENPLDAAKREFAEETGIAIRSESFVPLMPRRQPGGKLVYAWAAEDDFDAASVRSNLFKLEWPPRSGTVREFPEVDRAAWFPLPVAATKILRGQLPLLDDLRTSLGESAK